MFSVKPTTQSFKYAGSQAVRHSQVAPTISIANNNTLLYPSPPAWGLHFPARASLQGCSDPVICYLHLWNRDLVGNSHKKGTRALVPRWQASWSYIGTLTLTLIVIRSSPPWVHWDLGFGIFVFLLCSHVDSRVTNSQPHTPSSIPYPNNSNIAWAVHHYYVSFALYNLDSSLHTSTRTLTHQSSSFSINVEPPRWARVWAGVQRWAPQYLWHRTALHEARARLYPFARQSGSQVRAHTLAKGGGVLTNTNFHFVYCYD